jgi:hypothetical protein
MSIVRNTKDMPLQSKVHFTCKLHALRNGALSTDLGTGLCNAVRYELRVLQNIVIGGTNRLKSDRHEKAARQTTLRKEELYCVHSLPIIIWMTN